MVCQARNEMCSVFAAALTMDSAGEKEKSENGFLSTSMRASFYTVHKNDIASRCVGSRSLLMRRFVLRA